MNTRKVEGGFVLANAYPHDREGDLRKRLENIAALALVALEDVIHVDHAGDWDGCEPDCVACAIANNLAEIIAEATE